ncbi:MAG: LAGLIDADG family homing endonuclease [Alphaproteobacteria bacterium]
MSTTQMTPIASQIWDMKYRLKAADGAALDRTIEDTWRRVAHALAAPEAEPERWVEPFYRALEGFRFLPAGRIIAGAGTTRNVTLFNCFVMGRIPDDMTGIFEHLKEAALTMQQGGGIGYDFSTLRPKGAPVKGVGADASGPLSFMDVWDAMCRTIMSAGYRRGAMMATMRCDHPDIESFIEAKREPGRLRMFNLSVLVTDAFMAAVKADAPWPLSFGGTVFKTVQARELWQRIMRATYAYAEPGVIFIDRINRANNLHYCEEIFATNPCVSADTWVHTTEGPRQVRALIGRPFTALINGEPFAAAPEGFFKTGRKPLLKLVTREGHALRVTAEHPIRQVVEVSRDGTEMRWTEAGALRPGDRVALGDHRAAAAWPGPYSEVEGYLIGLLVGDGTLKADKAVLSVWPGQLAVGGGVARPGVLGVMARAEAAARTLPHRGDFQGWIEVTGRGEHRLALGALRRLAYDLGMAPGRKAVTPAIEAASSGFYAGFLRGFFDADGSVQGDQAKGVSVRLAQSDLARLEAVQRMLLRLGIVSTIHGERRPARLAVLPDGRGGHTGYATRAQHELIIANENLGRFEALIGFADTEKAARLKAALGRYRRRPNRERYVATIASIEPDGVEDVYDVSIPGANAFDANGIIVHNCGEQPLPPYGACLLGSVNLAALVERPFEPETGIDLGVLDKLVAVAVRMLDNAIDVSRFPLPAQAEEARLKRRIGLGVTGLADALIMCNARYGRPEALELTERWLAALRDAAYRASAELAKEKGSFPLFDAARYLEAEMIQALDPDLRASIWRHGIRNALLTSIAPTGTISLLAGNVSSGIEPVFSYSYTRNVLMPDGTRKAETVTDYAIRLHRQLKGESAALGEAFVDAEHLTPLDHLKMQAAAQKYVDSSISKTINVPEAIDFEAFKDIYHQAYELGCKGCTTYRPNPVTGAVLEAPSAEAKPAAEGERAPGTAPAEAREARAAVAVAPRQAELPLKTPAARPRDQFEAGGVVYMTQPLERPESLQGATYKLRWPESDHAIYITINDVVRDGRRRPFEIFVNSKNTEHYAWTVALTRMISAVFRRGGDVSFVVDELKAVFDPRGGQWLEGHYVPSLLAAIGGVIERHLIEIGFLPPPAAVGDAAEAETRIAAAGRPGTTYRLDPCPRCGQAGLLRQEGCDICTTCGYSKCA